MDTYRPLKTHQRCGLCALMPGGPGAGVTVHHLAPGEELPLPRRTAPTLYMHVVCQGCLKTVHHGRDGRVTISALHLPGETVSPATGSRRRIHHIATQASIVRSRTIDRATDSELMGRLLDMNDRRAMREGGRFARIAEARPVPSLAALILDLWGRAEGRSPAPAEVEIPMNRADVASYLGFEPETVSRAFAKLKASGAIVRRGWGNVTILDPVRLERLAEGRP